MFRDILLLFLSLVATFGLIELVVYVLRLRVENKALLGEVDALNNDLNFIEDMHRLFTELFRMSFTVLDLGQHILEKLFPDGGSCISMHGPVLRKMFEYILHSNLPSDFLRSGFCFTFKVHSSFADFQAFARAFARYIYANQMLLPGTSFIVTAMEPVRGVAEFRSRDQITIYSSYIFVVRFYDKNSQRSFELQFKCDAGDWCPEEDFDVNVLEFHATRRGLSALLNGRPLPVLSVVRAICEKTAQWNNIYNAHFNSIKNVIFMMPNMYSLHGCPSICPTQRCSFSFESSSFALVYSGCKCAPHVREISVGMLCQRLKSEQFSSLKCPYCKNEFPSLKYKPDCPRNRFSFDLSCLNEELDPEKLRKLQSEAQANVVKMDFESTYDETKLLLEQLSDISKAPFPPDYRIPGKQIDLLLFFGGEYQDEPDEPDEELLYDGYHDYFDDDSDDEDGESDYDNYFDDSEWDSRTEDSDSD